MTRKTFIAILCLVILLTSFVTIQAQSFFVQYKCNISYNMDTSQVMAPNLVIYNNSGAGVAYTSLELRYYRLKEGATGETTDVDFWPLGAANLNITYLAGYVSIKFLAGAGTLATGSNSGSMEMRIHKTDWSNYSQANDYSFGPAIVNYTTYDKVALFKDGVLVSGIEGPSVTPTPAPTPSPTPVTNGDYNYSDALQKAVWFFDANKCGPDVALNNVVYWRAACHTTDGSAVSLNLTGGYHDAGDHIKFGLPQAFAAGLLGWTLYEYRSTIDALGLTAKYLSTLKYFTDYFLRSHTDANTFYYQVSNKITDHAYWGSPEEYTGARPIAPPATLANSCSDITGSTAAALALMYLNYKTTDTAYANTCLNAAIEIYNIALQNNSRGTDFSDDVCYKSSSHYDDLSWGGIWLYIATNTASYLSPVAGWQDIPGDYGGSNWLFGWAPNWDNITPFVLLKLAHLTGGQNYKDAVTYNLNYFINTVVKTPNGLPYLDAWGSLRYATVEAGLGLLAYKLLNNNVYLTLAEKSVSYPLGNNPGLRSYITGWGYNPPVHPHHRANEPGRYTGGTPWGMVGGMVGGPDASDVYTDDIALYERSEVSIDFNVSLIFGLAGMIWYKGGSTPAPTSTTVTRTATATATMTATSAATATRTATSAATATRTATSAATATRTATSAATATRTATSAATATRTATTTATTVTRTATATATSTGSTGCTCVAGCATITVITPNFVKENVGEFCFEAASLGSFINSWGMDILQVNGVAFTNVYAAAASLPAAIGGKYYVYYKATSSSAHWEATN